MNAMTNLSRRGFGLSAAAVGGGLSLGLKAAFAAGKAGAHEFSTSLSIAADDTVTIHVPIPEIGNGGMTQCAMSVTEELGCAWSKVQTDVVSAKRVYLEGRTGVDAIISGGSTMDRVMKAMLQVGASGRERLKAAAAEVWKAPAGEIDVKDSVLIHRPTGRKLRFGQVAERAASVKLPAEPALKPQSE